MNLLGWLKDLVRVDDDEDEGMEALVPAAKREDSEASFFEPKRSNKVVNIHTTTQLQVVLVKPERYDNSTEIADHLKERRTVVLNLESTNKEAARRILDFLSGVAYANDGKIKRVANSTYIITPFNVDLKGDLIDELENNGLYI
ncbi:MAG: cell division protein SepF [Oscillospiraceae bacterium]|nr:cell division protein SepF [Oscillospiraceae bacterium]